MSVIFHARRPRRALITSLALALVAVSFASLASGSSGGAAETGRESIDGNRFVTDPAAEEPFGMHQAALAPHVGTSFIDRGRGAITFQFWSAFTPPSVIPPVAIGQQIVLTVELPASLSLNRADGWCDPNAGGLPRLYFDAACTATEYSNMTSQVRVVLTAKRNITSSHWSALRQNSIGVIGRPGQVAGAGRALISVEYPNDEGHFRRSTRELPFTTAVGLATDLDVRNVRAINDAHSGGGSTSFNRHDEGYLSFETNLSNPIHHGASLKTGESFTYTLRVPNNPNGGRGSLVYDADREPSESRPDACTRQLDGYDIRCEVTDSVIRLVTTRTGPDIVNDRPIADQVYVPVVSTYVSTDFPSAVVSAQVTLTANAEQWGNRPSLGVAEILLRGYPSEALGVRGLTVSPYVGSSFAEAGTGRLSFDFFRPGTPVPAYTLIEAGDALTVTVTSPAELGVSDAASGPEQGDRSRNWCDGLDSWGPELSGYLGTPTCATTSDPGSGTTTTTVTALAQQEIPNDALRNGFSVRVEAVSPISAGTRPVTVELASSRFGSVHSSYRQARTAANTVAGPSSGLGVWDAAAHLDSDDTDAPGSVVWSPDPDEASGASGPISVRTGDTITYRVQLPDGVAYQPGSANGADDVCALPDRYTGFTASCDVDGSTVVFTLVRTGADDGGYVFDDTLPFTLPLVRTTTGDVDGTVEILLSTTIAQSGSDHRRAVVPVEAAVAAVPEDTSATENASSTDDGPTSVDAPSTRPSETSAR